MMCDEEGVVAFKGIDPKVAVHVLVVSKEHVSSMGEVGWLPSAVAKGVLEVTEKFGIVQLGYGFKINNGSDAGEEILSPPRPREGW
ncbi:MAG TPA: HIT domain-containing protein [Rubrobacteraceae bacterium]|nr:HIT domain-containing protein [Rubrobacteraceae bacterium]